jgi:DNA-binding MarR family transcriptional regulator
MLEGILGNRTAEKVLIYIENYGSAYTRGVAECFSVSPSQVQKQLLRLEANGVLVSRLSGKTREFIFNPRFAFLPEIRALLKKAISLLPPEERKLYLNQRTRPRRTGKAL